MNDQLYQICIRSTKRAAQRLLSKADTMSFETYVVAEVVL